MSIYSTRALHCINYFVAMKYTKSPPLRHQFEKCISFTSLLYCHIIATIRYNVNNKTNADELQWYILLPEHRINS